MYIYAGYGVVVRSRDKQGDPKRLNARWMSAREACALLEKGMKLPMK